MSAPDITLYHLPGACSIASHILLHEARLNFNPHCFTSIPYPPSFREVNPKGKVPVLIVNGEVITEAPAIFTAVASLVPNLGLLGRTDLERIRVYEWVNWLSGSLHTQAYTMVISPAKLTDEKCETAVEGVRRKGIAMVGQCYQYIETKLEQKYADGKEENGDIYAVGDDYTVVDAYLVPFWIWGGKQIDMKSQFPMYTRLVHGVLKREATKVTLEKEGIKV